MLYYKKRHLNKMHGSTRHCFQIQKIQKQIPNSANTHIPENYDPNVYLYTEISDG